MKQVEVIESYLTLDLPCHRNPQSSTTSIRLSEIDKGDGNMQGNGPTYSPGLRSPKGEDKRHYIQEICSDMV